MPEKRTHDYVRHGTTTLFAAFNIADGTVITSIAPPAPGESSSRSSWPRSTPQVPADLDVHLVCDNYGTHKTPAIKTWLAAPPAVPHALHPDRTPRWLNQVERWFAYVTGDLLQRSDHRSIQALEADLRAWAKAWNDNPKPFIWTKTAEEILDLTRTTYRTNQRRRTLAQGRGIGPRRVGVVFGRNCPWSGRWPECTGDPLGWGRQL